ncbi:hypothetical protein Vi05172_g1542 [Venturia inaequalis]|nr:hypothetical protein Vi05172_g1542 [Venturia inaequalis]
MWVRRWWIVERKGRLEKAWVAPIKSNVDVNVGEQRHLDFSPPQPQYKQSMGRD